MTNLLNSVKNNLDTLQNAMRSNNTTHQVLLEPMLIEFRQKIQVFSDMSSNLSQSQGTSDDVKGLIKDVRSIVEYVIQNEEQKTKQNSLFMEPGLQGQEFPAPVAGISQRRKSHSNKKRKASNVASSSAGLSRQQRFRKKAKLNYSENTDVDDTDQNWPYAFLYHIRRSIFEHIINEEEKTKQNSLFMEPGLQDQDYLPAPISISQRRKYLSSQKRKASIVPSSSTGPSKRRRFRKEVKLNYSESTDLDDTSQNWPLCIKIVAVPVSNPQREQLAYFWNRI